MKIASRIHNRDGSARTVTIHGRPYIFAKTEDLHGNLHFVADVRNEQHAKVLLQKPHFYEFGDELEPQSTLLRASLGSTSRDGSTDLQTTSTGTQATEAGSGAHGSATVTATPIAPTVTFAGEVTAAAQELLGGNVSMIAAALGRITDLDVVRCALALENAGQARKSAIAILTQTLELAAQAKG
ncbi:hypothetical protein [Dyella japonica]|uniref:Uncharacterized protein n=1 Tax=Dyella japonica DSM 16301 TaxID=1440762 RepID=A0A0G9H754_9GAMM|nr:hypothetical protein [Dyella japonica]KLD65428.1 hypothetical protein Y882_02585 [Dyella japonica DSM 16301]